MRALFILFAIAIPYMVGAQGISIDAGYMVVSGKVVLTDGFGINVNGILNSQNNSSIGFYGNSLQKIKGSGTLDFNTMELNNSAAGVQLISNASLSNTLIMTASDFDLLDQDLDLGSTGTVSGENTNAMIKATDGSGNYSTGNNAGNGRIIHSITISTTGLTNIAGLGIDVTPQSNWGACSLWREHQQVVGVQNDLSVFRKYTIVPTNAANLQANISIGYDAAELNGNTSGALKMYQLKDNGAKGVDWEELNSTDNGSKVTATTNDNNLSEISITLAGASSVLPVSLLSFASYCDGNMVRLQWKTASETNNDYFILERSVDGQTYNELAQIQGQGNSNSLVEYEYLDFAEENTPIYYRLSQVDYDGKTTVFNPIVSRCGENTDFSFKVVNPAKNKLIIMSNRDLEQEVTIYLYDMGGKQLLMKSLPQNRKQWVIPVNTLASGVYQLVFQGIRLVETKSIILTD